MTADLRVTFESEALNAGEVQLYELYGVEECSQLFWFDLVLVARDHDAFDLNAVVTGGASLAFTRDDEVIRRVYGMVASVHDLTLTEARDYTAWRVRFVPRAFRLNLSETVDIYMDLDVRELIEKKLRDAGLRAGADVEFRLSKKYVKREFVVQYQETDLNFISRQAEHFGITFFFEHDEKDKVIFTDANSVLKPLDGAATVPYHAHHTNEMGDLRAFALESETRALPGRYVMRDYNYRTPGQDLRVGATVLQGAPGEVVEYGAHFKTPEEGQRLVRVRAEELLATRVVYTGRSNVPMLAPGGTFTLQEHPRGDLELLVTRVEHRRRQAVFGMPSDLDLAYENVFKAIDKAVTYRPPRLARKPVVSGVVTGVVDAASKSNYAEIDDEGRYRVKFMYDTAQRGEGQASRLVRMAQPSSGPGYGMHFPLRPGIEVILSCVNGDPDRPIIAGTVPNPATGSPVTKGNLARNILRTGGGNEMNFDDTEGEHRLKISIPHADTTFQLGSPNSPERGAMLATAESWSAYAGSVATTVSNASNVFAATAKLLASTNITAFAGVSNALDKAEAVVGIIEASADFAKDAAGLPKTWRDIAQKRAESTAAAYKSDTLRAATELARAKRDQQQRMARVDADVAAAQARADAAHAAYPEAQSPPPDPNNPDQVARHDAVIAAERDLAAAREQQAKEKATTDKSVAKAKETKDKADKAVEDNPAAQAAQAEADVLAAENAEAAAGGYEQNRAIANATVDGVRSVKKAYDKGKEALKSGKELFSSAAKRAAEAAKNSAAVLAAGAAGAATSFGALPRISGGVGSRSSPWNIQGATGTAALIGLANALVASPVKVGVSAGSRVVVGAGSQALLHSPVAAEVTGVAKVFLTSATVIDAKSGARIKTFSGATTQMKSVGPFTLQTNAMMKIKATGPMKINAGPVIDARAQNIKMKASSKFDVKAANVKVDASSAIKMKAGSKVEAKVGGSTVRITSGHVTMAKGGTMAKVTGSNAMMKHGGTKLTLSGSGAKLSGPKAKISGSGGVKITGAKIDLG